MKKLYALTLLVLYMVSGMSLIQANSMSIVCNQQGINVHLKSKKGPKDKRRHDEDNILFDQAISTTKNQIHTITKTWNYEGEVTNVDISSKDGKKCSLPAKNYLRISISNNNVTGITYLPEIPKKGERAKAKRPQSEPLMVCTLQ